LGAFLLEGDRVKPLQGEIAWITGGSGGIGKTVAIELAAAGADVIIGYRSAETAARQIEKTCRQSGVRTLAVPVDVRKRESVFSAYQEIALHLGSPTILVHAAGNSFVGLIQDVAETDYDNVMDTHVRGAFSLIQAVLPAMIKRQKGRIVLISSIWGQTGGAGEVLYSAAKGAQISMAKALAKELAPSGITVNAIAPGAIQTPMLEEQLTTEERLTLAEEIPAGRLGRPEEVASMVRYVCSPEAAYVTGQVLAVNGGWYT
jgi:3-oxoacyl-[acyl-carrier protein] reductase